MDYYYGQHHHKKDTKKEETPEKTFPESKEETPPVEPKLTDLRGLGKVTASKLNEEGITTLEQLAALSPEQVDLLDEKIKNFKANFDNWAKLAAEKINL